MSEQNSTQEKIEKLGVSIVKLQRAVEKYAMFFAKRFPERKQKS